MLARSTRTLALLASVAGLGAGALGAAALAVSQVPSDLDMSLDRATRNGAYRVHLAPTVDPVPLHKIHSWDFIVRDRAGHLVSGAAISVDGGMPQHGHGLPTRPVARAGAPGHYVVSGVKFSMDGWWVLKFTIEADGVSDDVTFNLAL